MTQKLRVAVSSFLSPMAGAVLARLGTAHPEVEVTVAANEHEFLEHVSP
jgi:hypothetical protein